MSCNDPNNPFPLVHWLVEIRPKQEVNDDVYDSATTKLYSLDIEGKIEDLVKKLVKEHMPEFSVEVELHEG